MTAFPAALLALALITEPAARQALERATVKEVVSSDTVVVAIPGDPSLWVTLLGVGKPEVADPRKDKFLLGKADLNWLQAWLPPGTPVLMERRGESFLGRPLVVLYRIEDQFCWNAYLVKTGGAFAHEQAPFPEFRKYLAMERDAKAQRKGLWTAYPTSEPASAPTAGSPIPIRRIVADARSGVKPAPPRANPGNARTVFTPENVTPPRRRRPRYASQDQARAEADLMMGMMFQGMMSGGYGGGYPGGYDPAKTVHVNPYYRSNGTYVQEHWRRPPSR